jgi:hypothetical protein
MQEEELNKRRASKAKEPFEKKDLPFDKHKSKSAKWVASKLSQTNLSSLKSAPTDMVFIYTVSSHRSTVLWAAIKDNQH